MTPVNYELLLQQERQRNSELELRVNELTAALEKLREEQTQIKLQLEAALQEKKQWQEDRLQRSFPLMSSSTHRPIRIRSMQLKLARPKSGKCPRTHPHTIKSLQSLPEVMRQHVQQQVSKRQKMYASVIENQKTSAATEQTARALQERLHITEQNDTSCIGINVQNSVTYPQFPGQDLASEDQHKRKLMQQRLKSYLHSQTCRAPDDDQEIFTSNKQWHCGQIHCATMKKVLVHMKNCTGEMDCTVPLCSSTREVTEHWKSCVNDDCVICRPAKQTLLERSEVLAKTLEALNEGMDVTSPIDDTNSPCSSSSCMVSSGSNSSLLSVTNTARRVTYIRLPRGFSQTFESEAESDVGA